MARLGRPALLERRLPELEDQPASHVLVLGEEFKELREEVLIAQRGQRDVAEDGDLAILARQPPYDLHAAEQQQIVDRRHQAFRLGDAEILSGHKDLPGLVAQARKALVEDGAALRQADHRLQVEVHAVVGQGLADGGEQGDRLGIVAAARAGDRRLGRRGQSFVQADAHALDQFLQHAHFECQLLSPLDRLFLDRLGEDGQAVVDLLELGGDGEVGLAQDGEVALERGVVHGAAHYALEREAQAQACGETRRARSPSAARAPHQERDREGQADGGAAKKRQSELAHGARPFESVDYRLAHPGSRTE